MMRTEYRGAFQHVARAFPENGGQTHRQGTRAHKNVTFSALYCK
jgi:hypothetical protein